MKATIGLLALLLMACQPGPIQSIGIPPTPTPSVTSFVQASPTGESPSPSATSSPRPTPFGPSGNTVLWKSGIASWGYFAGHAVTRLRRGTSIVIVGPLGTWRGRSWGYGPKASTGRVADLDISIFRDICGPSSLGLCDVKVYIVTP